MSTRIAITVGGDGRKLNICKLKPTIECKQRGRANKAALLTIKRKSINSTVVKKEKEKKITVNRQMI